MSATVRQFTISDAELKEATPTSYNDIVVPADYEAILEKVEDYDKTSTGGSTGWIMTFRIEGLPFKTWISHSARARWKLVETVHAFKPGFFDDRGPDGTTKPLNVNEFVGRTVGAHVDYDPGLDTPRKVIRSLFSLVDEPEVEDVPTI